MKRYLPIIVGVILLLLFICGLLFILKTENSKNLADRKLRFDGHFHVSTQGNTDSYTDSNINLIEAKRISRSGSGTDIWVYEYLGDTIMVSSRGGMIKLSK